MIELDGTLKIKIYQGSRGEFHVGELLTSIGVFKVKDPILDQYEAGSYQGRFVINKIFPSAYTWHGKVIAEIRASLDRICVDDAPPAAANDRDDTPPPEPDPIEDPPPKPLESRPSRRTSNSAPAAPSAAFTSAELIDDSALFGELAATVATGAVVKLDPTVDRGLFRSQRDRLKALGFKFSAPTQTWSK